MPIGFKAAGIGGSLLAIIALVIVFLKQIIALISLIMGFIGILTFVIKAVIVLIFVAVFLGVGLMIYRTWSDRQRSK